MSAPGLDGRVFVPLSAEEGFWAFEADDAAFWPRGWANAHRLMAEHEDEVTLLETEAMIGATALKRR